ncbi:hypothetical protein L6164_022304 [Bauhinia variegata]|uniref:Uncharacterized protein n=1 Tax=Bauhinia variegata TaxID=167791 RepID=A0ACB9MF92_BAUVA|nr:hypothetical protein L6164_022304 [Bauhinia variegata]
MVSWSVINHDDDDDSDYEDEDGSRHATKGPIRSKNELETLPPVPSVDVNLQPHHQSLAVGVVMSRGLMKKRFQMTRKAELEKTHRMAKRGINDQNKRKRRNNRKKVPQKEGEVPSHPVGLATTLFAHGNCSTFQGTGSGLLRETTRVPPFQLPADGLNPPTNGVWTNCTFPQPQSSMLPNALTTNGISWFQENTQNSYQLPVPGIPFQQPLNPNQASLSTNMNAWDAAKYISTIHVCTGLVNQNQLTFGLSSNLPPM